MAKNSVAAKRLIPGETRKATTTKQFGDACEMLVVAKLTLNGMPTMKLPDTWPGYDLIAQPIDRAAAHLGQRYASSVGRSLYPLSPWRTRLRLVSGQLKTTMDEVKIQQRRGARRSAYVVALAFVIKVDPPRLFGRRGGRVALKLRRAGVKAE